METLSEGPVARPWGISQFFSSVSREEFLASFLGKKLLHERGTGRFSDWLPWGVLNDILLKQRLDYPRIRVTVNGQPLSRESFIDDRVRISGAPSPSIDVWKLHKLLSSGALLSIDAVDELHGPIRQAASDVEFSLGANVQVNAYVGWNEQQGFRTHWDAHDVIIAQVAGCKHWRLFGPTTVDPVDHIPGEIPPSEILWEGTLAEGDSLYVPRGWWHDAKPVGEATAHLTFGVTFAKGLDIVKVISQRLRNEPFFRRDVPQFLDEVAQANYINELASRLVAEISATRLSDLLADIDGQAQRLGEPVLPWAVMPEQYPLAEHHSLRWTPPRATRFESDEKDVWLIAFGVRWSFSKACEPILNALSSAGSVSVSYLREVGRSKGQSDRAVDQFLVQLLKRGLAAPNSDKAW